MHGFRRVIVSGWILLLLPIVGAVAAEGLPRTQFNFKTPSPVAYEVAPLAKRAERPLWLQAHERDRPGVRVEFGSQIILRLAKGQALSQATAGLGLEFVREFAPQLFILEARSVWNALVAAETLGLRDGVQVSHPVRRRPMQKMTRLAKRPNDPLFPLQWTLENRDAETGAILGQAN